MIDFELAPSAGEFQRTKSSLGFLSTLNERQTEAVKSTDGPLIVLAGAGSGKTKMLTSRIAYLVEARGVHPQNILAVTFTNKAAKEMRERVAIFLSTSNALHLPEIGTFHSVCLRILRREIDRTPFKQQFVIYDDSDQLHLLKDVVGKLNIDEKSFTPKALQAGINRLKCDAVEPHQVKVTPHNVFEKQLQKVYEQYQKDLFSNNAIDFGEIICIAYRLLRDHSDLREKYQNRYKFIHVDEYQDTNRAQYLLLSTLAGMRSGGHQNICVVGDEDQSIYRWRGADIRNILDFEQDYPGAKVVKLEQNYRSTKSIINAAAQVIRNNRSRKDKTLWTANEDGAKVIRVQLPDERTEAEMVVSEIKRHAASDNLSYGDFSIFYRTHAQSRQFEDVLRREKVPHQIFGGLRFYDRKEIKDVLAYFKVITNPADSVSLKRIINVPARGIGKTTIDKIEDLYQTMQVSQEGGATYWDALKRSAQDVSITSAGTAKKIAGFVNLIEKLMSEQPKLLVSELYHMLLDEIGYVRDLRQEGTEESAARIENLEEFDSVLQEFEEENRSLIEAAEANRSQLLSIFIEQSSLVSDLDLSGSLTSSVNLMTLHSSKGLEFKIVFLVGMEEGLFPSSRPWEEEDPQEMEEERRLCYVGMTRARQQLYLSNVLVRRIWGNISYQDPARFFSEISDELIDFKDLSYGNASGSYKLGSSKSHGYSDRPKSTNFNTSTGFRSGLVGQKIQHPEYGAGTIIATEGLGEDQKVTIEFRGKVQKKFLLRYVSSYVT